MRFEVLQISVLIGLLAGCNVTKQGSTAHFRAEQKQTINSTSSPSQPNLSVAEAAQLTKAQFEQLVSLDKNNSKKVSARIVLPTYIPPGFQVDMFNVSDDIQYGFGPRYDIVYRHSSNNSCFSISGGFALPIGGPPAGYKSVEVSAPAFGKVRLIYLNFEQNETTSFVAFENDQIIKEKYGYSFRSAPPSNIIRKRCTSISIQEAKKIVESFKYMTF